MKLRTSKLIGAALDWAAAKSEGHEAALAEGSGLVIIRRQNVVDYFDPSTNWGWGGPIIDKLKGLLAKHWLASNPATCWEAHLHNYEGNWVAFGPTALIAAMRCFVASKLGDEVDVPEELPK